MLAVQKPSSLSPTMTFGGRTAYGHVTKKTNEDSWVYFEIETGSETVVIAIVADGVGGAVGGALASRIAVSAVQEWFEEIKTTITDPHALDAAITAAVHHANIKIIETSRKTPAHLGMSTTMILAAIGWGQLQIAYVGDSRAYLLRNRGLSRLTLDHAWSQDALDKGIITQADLSTHPNRNVIDRFLGASPQIDIDRKILGPGQYDRDYLDREFVGRLNMQPGDLLLLCSDGLNSCISDTEIEEILKTSQQDPQQSANRLVVSALRREVKDNTTVLVLANQHPRNFITRSERRSRLFLATTAALIMLCLGYLMGNGHQDSIVQAIQENVSSSSVLSNAEPSAVFQVTLEKFSHEDKVSSSIEGDHKHVTLNGQVVSRPLSPVSTTIHPTTVSPTTVSPTTVSPTTTSVPVAMAVVSQERASAQPLGTSAPATESASSTVAPTASPVLKVIASPATKVTQFIVVTVTPQPTQPKKILVVTATPDQTNTSIPTATTQPVTLTATPTTTPTATLTSDSPTQSESARVTGPLLSNIASIQILAPNSIDTTTPNWQEFSWTFSGSLAPAHGFEVVLWEERQNPMQDGIGVTSASKKTSVLVDFSKLSAHQPVFEAKQRYYWGILLVNLQPYRRIQLLHGGQVVTFLGK